MEFNYDTIWDGKWGDMQKYGPVHRHHRRMTKKILKGIEVNSVLDVGCGEGSNLQFLSELFPSQKFTGIDISESALRIAKGRIPHSSFHRVDCQKSKLDEKFDLVFCSDVLEHLQDDDAALKNLYAMTNKYCLVATVQGRMRNFEHGIGHVRNYQYGELESKMKSAGFKIIKQVAWGWPLYSPLYRDFLDIGTMEKQTGGTFGLLKKTAAQFLYFLFLLNSKNKGDVIFVLAQRNNS